MALNNLQGLICHKTQPTKPTKIYTVFRPTHGYVHTKMQQACGRNKLALGETI